MSRGIGRGDPHKHHREQRNTNTRCPRCQRTPTKRGRLCPRCKPLPVTLETTGEITMDMLVPISHLGLEGINTAEVTRRYANEILLDDLNRECLDRATAAAILAQHRAETAARRERQRRRDEAWRANYAEITRRSRAQVRGGVPATPGSTALADLHAAVEGQ